MTATNVSEKAHTGPDLMPHDEDFRSTFELAPVGIAHTSVEGGFLQVNAKLCDMLGYTRTELLELSTDDLNDPEDRVERLAELLPELLSGGRASFSVEKRYLRKDGTAIWVNRMVTVAHRRATGERYLIQVIDDISERKRTEAQLEHMTRARRVMAECNHVLIHAVHESEMLGSMCRILVESGGYKLAWVGLASGDPVRPIHPAAHAGYGADAPMTAPAGWSADGRYQGFMLDVVETGEPHVARDILNDPKYAQRWERALQHGFRSSIALPLKSEGVILGAIAICAQEADAFDAQEIALLTALAGDVAYGINNLRTRAAREHAEAAARENERRFELTFDYAAVGILHISLDRRILLANRKFLSMSGYALDELQQLPSVGDISHPDDLNGDGDLEQRLLGGEIDTYASERRYVSKLGRVIWTRQTTSLARSAGSPQYYIRVIEDVTQTKLNEERYRAMFENAAVGITRVGLDGVLVDVNQKFCSMLGYARGELIGKAVKDVTYPDDFGQGAQFRAGVIEGEMLSAIGEKRFVCKNGAIIWARRTMSVARDDTGKPQYVISVVEDISERKRAEDALRTSEETLRATFSQAGVGIIITSPDHRYLQVNDKYCDMVGYTREELLDMSNTEVLSPGDVSDVIENRRKLICGELQTVTHERQLRRKDGSMIWVNHATSLARGQNGEPRHFITVAEDISERKRAEERLTQLAHFDVLTGLPNRMLFYDRLKHGLAQAKRNTWELGVMFIDIDRFKNINDTLGHAIGDSLLQQVALRLSGSVRSGDTVGRLGGDEFGVVLSTLTSGDDAALLAQKIITSFSDPFSLNNTDVYVTASIGITIYPDDATDQDALIKNADIAMYRAKEEGRNTYEFYAAGMHERAADRHDMEILLRRALERQELALHYEPKIALGDGRLVGAAALLRWDSEELGMVDPARFIPIAEESGLNVPIGEWMLRAACAQNRAWQDQGLSMLVSVAISARQFQHKNLVETVAAVLRETGLDARFLELEIAERMIMPNAEKSGAVLERLHELGVQLTIGDFGSGYSSLAHLKRFPVQRLKIDPTFVRDIAIDSDDAAIVTAVVAMAKSLKLRVVAQGVERQEQLDFLARLRCEECQGGPFGSAVPPAEFVRVFAGGVMR